MNFGDRHVAAVDSVDSVGTGWTSSTVGTSWTSSTIGTREAISAITAVATAAQG